MIIPLVLALVAGVAPEVYVVDQVEMKIEQFDGEALITPHWITTGAELLFACDSKTSKIWRMNADSRIDRVFAGGGEGPGELEMFIVAFYLAGDELKVIHDQGNKISAYDLAGNHKVTSRAPAGSSYIFELGNDRFLGGIEAGQVTWKRADGTIQDIDLVDNEKDDAGRRFFASHLGGKVFICTSSSRQNQIYFTLVDSAKGEVEDIDSLTLTMKSDQKDYPKNIPANVVLYPRSLASLTASEELGFVMNECTMKPSKYASPHLGNLCVLRIYEPNLHEQRTLRVYLGDNPYMFAFQHLTGDRWVAAVSGGLYVVTLRQISNGREVLSKALPN